MTTLTIEVEVGLDVPADVLGMWIAQQLNHCDAEAEDPDSLAPHFEELDSHDGPITVMWRAEPEVVISGIKFRCIFCGKEFGTVEACNVCEESH